MGAPGKDAVAYRTSASVITTRCVLACLSVTVSFLGPLLGEDIANAEDLPLAMPYVSAFVMRSQPTGGRYSYKGDNIPALTIDPGTGGGVKVGAFFRPLNYAFGFEWEVFAYDGKLSAPQTTNGGVTRFANLDFTMVNLMGNVLVQYRGDLIQPYIGGGAGLAVVVTDGQAQSQGGLQTGSHDMLGFAAQAIAGARLVVTQHIFLFAEYKYLVASVRDDPCSEEDKNNGTCRVLGNLNDFQSNFAVAGIGFSF